MKVTFIFLAPESRSNVCISLSLSLSFCVMKRRKGSSVRSKVSDLHLLSRGVNFQFHRPKHHKMILLVIVESCSGVFKLISLSLSLSLSSGCVFRFSFRNFTTPKYEIKNIRKFCGRSGGDDHQQNSSCGTFISDGDTSDAPVNFFCLLSLAGGKR